MYYNYCEYCGDYSNGYPLCYDCYQASLEEKIIQNEFGEWVTNIKKGNEYKFYNKDKKYHLKNEYLNKIELQFYNYVKTYLKKEFIIIPQVNLQTIIETNTATRNDELFRNLDFCIFQTKNLKPILAIELNGKQHYSNKFYTNEYNIERDKSISNILYDANLKLLTLKNEEIIFNEELLNLIYKEINNSNDDFFKDFFIKKELIK